MAKVIMIQGTMSNAGKSLIAAGLCRIFRQDGYKVAPFKSQNMALNSFITKEGLEMGRAQVMQAEAAGTEPSYLMNPILLKPTNHTGSQVIVNGEVLGNMQARDYFAYKKKLIPDIKKAFGRLERQYDIIVIEGAGSPAEINLKENDIVNMGMAEMVNAPVLLVGDIDRGGVFAQLLGTLMLLTDEERKRVKGLLINKFRGDKTILDPGITMLEERGRVPVAGVVPYMELSLPDEDSLTERFHNRREGLIDIAVIRYPRISNFTDLDVFESLPQVSVRYVTSAAELYNPDLVILPGSKNTMGDLKWMRQNGLEARVKRFAETKPVFGICGGYQMLGLFIEDPHMVEEGGSLRGMELLPVQTVLEKEKTRTRVQGSLLPIDGVLSELSGMEIEGYEIHMGYTEAVETGAWDKDMTAGKTGNIQGSMSDRNVCKPFAGLHKLFQNDQSAEEIQDGFCCGNVYGSYVHGIFDKGNTAERVVQALAAEKGVRLTDSKTVDYAAFKESQYDKLADTMRTYLDMEYIYSILQEADFSE